MASSERPRVRPLVGVVGLMVAGVVVVVVVAVVGCPNFGYVS